MPVYAYACTACGHAFEARQGFDEPSLTVCERCQGALRKQYGTVGVTFNGSGFYRTDSRAASGAAKAPTGGSSSSSSASSGSSSSSSSSSSSD
ncbi:FmdB family zinc ribbon protein [Agrococcus jenensis]|uniref:Putative FmdB family regulatory protein n=1 Tax=Agrococcus jenensis TaxID=46353 RepID=A0A3N2ATB2_9MICO|nr:FmdB family zinc ribbon protein [Agrococcus jenensis]ROR66226.1 putative FmdB family regulatory protein [Agrococcus jenensis]